MQELLSSSTRSQPVITCRREGRGAAINIEKERVMGYRSTGGWSKRDPRYRLANSKQRQVLWGREAPRALTWWSFFERQGRKRANSAQDSDSEVIDTTCETSSSKIVERRCQRGAAVWFEQVNKWVEGFRGRSWELNAQHTPAGKFPCNKTEKLNKTQKCTCCKYIKQLKLNSRQKATKALFVTLLPGCDLTKRTSTITLLSTLFVCLDGGVPEIQLQWWVVQKPFF